MSEGEQVFKLLEKCREEEMLPVYWCDRFFTSTANCTSLLWISELLGRYTQITDVYRGSCIGCML